MHQSPQKPLAGRREKFFDFELAELTADRRPARDTQPKARKFPLREESERGTRRNKAQPGR